VRKKTRLPSADAPLKSASSLELPPDISVRPAALRS